MFNNKLNHKKKTFLTIFLIALIIFSLLSLIIHFTFGIKKSDNIDHITVNVIQDDGYYKAYSFTDKKEIATLLDKFHDLHNRILLSKNIKVASSDSFQKDPQMYIRFYYFDEYQDIYIHKSEIGVFNHCKFNSNSKIYLIFDGVMCFEFTDFIESFTNNFESKTE